MRKAGHIQTLILMALLTWVMVSCENDSLPELHKYTRGSGLFICNEGTFSYGNASLSFYDPETGEVLNDVFYNANAFPVGDVLQSVNFRDSLAYLVVSNSGKILVMNSNTFVHVGTLTGLGSPRNIEIINENKAYVSDLYSPYLSIVNPQDFSISGALRLGNSSETFIRYGDLLFIASWSYNDKIYIINTIGDELVDSVSVRKQPNSMVLDKNNKLWVLSDGGYEGSPYGQVKAALTRINAENLLVEKVFEFSEMANSPVELCINGAGDSLFFINGGWSGAETVKNGIYAMGIQDEKLPVEAFIASKTARFYALSIDPGSSRIYCSDALDFLQRGYVYSFSPEGIPVDSFKVGIAPGGFGFKHLQ
ncbi:MAG: YncE family protein [Bacteroidales bacterium]|nr:YncE family protein [Bacteroidales bacterium]